MVIIIITKEIQKAGMMVMMKKGEAVCQSGVWMMIQIVKQGLVRLMHPELSEREAWMKRSRMVYMARIHLTTRKIVM